MKLLIASFLVSSCVYAADVPAEFATAGVVPDVLTKAPNDLLTIAYKVEDKDKIVQIGEELTPTMVKDPPLLTWNSEDSAYYTVVMIDPDFPTREDPKYREVLLWMACNIPGNDLTKGEVIVEYIGIGPGKDTGFHRYVLLVYKQPEKLTIEEPRISNHEHNGRGSFSVNSFATKYKLGDSIAGNIFKAQYDDYVPIVLKQVGLA